ncbi:M1 family metallopeptidase [Maribacter sp. 2307ULW6-5]|uniref:M1 family metallopeptidase n=1 Tax=Maribacter sp. 2307ULW6-5 TaxID=3386275 RepID=UPI0039BC2653
MSCTTLRKAQRPSLPNNGLYALLFICLGVLAQGQETLYMPLEFKKAYENGSRSLNGLPGKNYWQNHSVYDIEVEIVPGTWKILGTQHISYTNHSPDSLDQVVIRMYPNHYKKGGLRANEMPLSNLTEGMQITDLTVNGEPVALEKSTFTSELAHADQTKKEADKISVSRKATYLVLELSDPLPPKSVNTFTMAWSTEMPLEYVNKIGAYDAESAFVGYWYPQIAVYDDIDGWDKTEYTGAQECYTDFADFNVKVKVPKGNYVLATGHLQNPEAVFSEKELERYQALTQSGQTITVLDAKKRAKETTSSEIWHYSANNVRDFGLGVSNNFTWLGKPTLVGDRTVASNILFSERDQENLRDLMNVQNHGIQFLSNKLPGVAFPYDSFTTFVGVPEFDGMEFPMMANNGFSKNEIRNNLMTFHEVAHTYLPHWVGVNEIKYSWMEEGWVTFLSIKYCQDLYRGTEHENFELERSIRSYNRSAGTQWGPPLFTPSNYMVIRSMHFQQSYRKPAFMYLALEDLLGEEVFKKCLQAYLERWKEKHPTPYDFMFTFNDVSGQNLNWFWNKWVFGHGHADVGIAQLEGDQLELENLGGFPVPVSLKVTYKDGNHLILKKTAGLWSKGNDKVQITIPNAADVSSVGLITDAFPDVVRGNNELQLPQ